MCHPSIFNLAILLLSELIPSDLDDLNTVLYLNLLANTPPKAFGGTVGVGVSQLNGQIYTFDLLNEKSLKMHSKDNTATRCVLRVTMVTGFPKKVSYFTCSNAQW